MTSRTYTQEEIQDLTDRVYLLREQFEAGKIHFASHLVDDFIESYRAIRIGPDGLVDPTSVDGRIRSATLANSAFRYREDAKNELSLAQIQEAYFELLYREFGSIYEQMKEAGSTPSQAARVMVRDVAFVSHVVSVLPDLAANIKEYWETVSDAASFHLQDGRQLKATFAGDLFPAYWENAVSTAGLYLDTIILPCPITRIVPLINVIPDREVVAMLVKHCLTALSYRTLATADIEPPIVLIIPNPDDVDSDRRKDLVERAVPAIRSHAEYLFGRPFETLEHLKDFCDHLVTVDQALNELKGGDRLLFDTEWVRGARAQLSRVMAEQTPLIPGTDASIAGHYIFGACLGRMPQAMGAQENAMHFGGTPLINAETSWLHYTWLLEYEAQQAPDHEHDRQSMHVVRALVSEGQNNLEWLGNVPPETVLEIRKNGLAEEVRSLLSRGVADLIGINPSNYFQTADQVVENLDRAFREHQNFLQEAKLRKLKLYGIDVASCVAVGGVSIAAALTGSSTLGAISGVLGIAGLPNLKDIKTKFLEIAAEDRARKASPTGLLFRHIRK